MEDNGYSVTDRGFIFNIVYRSLLCCALPRMSVPLAAFSALFKLTRQSLFTHFLLVFDMLVLHTGQMRIPSVDCISVTLWSMSSVHLPSDVVCSFTTFCIISWIFFLFYKEYEKMHDCTHMQY